MGSWKTSWFSIDVAEVYLRAPGHGEDALLVAVERLERRRGEAQVPQLDDGHAVVFGGQTQLDRLVRMPGHRFAPHLRRAVTHLTDERSPRHFMRIGFLFVLNRVITSLS